MRPMTTTADAQQQRPQQRPPMTTYKDISTPPLGAGLGSEVRPAGRWALYDEKLILSGKGGYDPKSPQTWLQSTRDYLAGRTDEIDGVLDWAEAQTEPIASEPDRGNESFPMIHYALSAKELSRQLWAFLGSLVAGDSKSASIYNNVPRHNGLEAWRRIAELINEDQI